MKSKNEAELKMTPNLGDWVDWVVMLPTRGLIQEDNLVLIEGGVKMVREVQLQTC